MWNTAVTRTSKWISFWKMDKLTDSDRLMFNLGANKLLAHHAPILFIDRIPLIFVYFSNNSGERTDYRNMKGKFRFLRWNIRLKGLHHKDYWPKRNDTIDKAAFFRTLAAHRAEINLAHEAAIACILKQI